MFFLDTDHLTLFLKGQPAVTRRVLAVPFSDLAITIVTVEEQLGGWYGQIRKSRNNINRLERAYQGLCQVIDVAARMPVIPFSRPALERHAQLKQQFRRVGRLDLAIASIAIENDATVVTRNRSDFEQIPGLRIEDWTE